MSGALELRSADLIRVPVPGVTVLPLGLAFTEELSDNEWKVVGLALGLYRDWTAWSIGDWLVAGEMFRGEDFAQAAEVLGRKPESLQQFVRVALRFPHDRRRSSLTWAHHQAVASRAYEAEEADRLLDEAERHKWSVQEFRTYLRPEPPGHLADAEEVIEAARDLVRAARCLGSFECFVPTENVLRLREVLGEEPGL